MLKLKVIAKIKALLSNNKQLQSKFWSYCSTNKGTTQLLRIVGGNECLEARQIQVLT